ncbi:MAG: glutathione S-transferase family protein [Hyphomicrobiaceae bacterium]
MILIGQYDSPFVRRVGIALRLYDMPFEHRPWSVFGEAEKIRPLNPLVRVPTFVADDATVLVDSASILDYLDYRKPEAKRLVPATEPARHKALRIMALGMGLAEKAVSLFYEQRLHDQISAVWAERCRGQAIGVIETLETERTGTSTTYWHGERIGHADIAVAAALRFLSEAHPQLIDWRKAPALEAHCAHCEALAVFQEISQPFIPPT